MRKLLLADDSVTIQRVIELTFSGEDIHVVAVNDGEQAIARIPAEQPDVVLADIGMPRKGGYDVAAFVKGRPDLSHIPVLLLAGAFEPVDQTRAEQVGADGVLIKPFEPRQVIERVKELLAAVRPTISAEVVQEPTAPVDSARTPAEPAVPGIAATGKPSMPPAVETPAAPQVQSLDDLFESLNQALSERAVAPAVPPAPVAHQAAPVAPVPAPATESTVDAIPLRPTTSWTEQKEWMTVADTGPFEGVPFDKAGSPSTSAATLDDYFDRLSAAFSHTRPARTSEAVPERLDDFGHVTTAGEPPAASHEWLGQAGEPQGLQAFESGEADGNPILGAVSTLMARARAHHQAGDQSHASHPGAHGHAMAGATAPPGTPQVFQGPTLNGTYAPPVQHDAGTAPAPPASVAQARAVEGARATPWNAFGVPATSTELVDIVTERVLARIVPELTEHLRRLVQQEIARNR